MQFKTQMKTQTKNSKPKKPVSFQTSICRFNMTSSTFIDDLFSPVLYLPLVTSPIHESPLIYPEHDLTLAADNTDAFATLFSHPEVVSPYKPCALSTASLSYFPPSPLNASDLLSSPNASFFASSPPNPPTPILAPTGVPNHSYRHPTTVRTLLDSSFRNNCSVPDVCAETGLSVRQVRNYFDNKRRREGLPSKRFSAEQKQILDEEFDHNRYLTKQKCLSLSLKVGLTPKQTRSYFRHKRERNSKQL